MMFSLAILSSPLAHALEPTLHEFKCVTDRAFQGSVSRFEFRVENLASGTISYGYLDAAAEDEDLVVRQTSPRRGNSIRTLNDNWGIRRMDNGIRASGDGDGCEYITLYVYKTRNYSRGYIRFKDGGCGAGDDEYTTISCRVRSVR